MTLSPDVDLKWNEVASKLISLRQTFSPDEFLLDALYAKKLICKDERDKLILLTIQQRVSELITNILPFKGSNSFNDFVSVLRETEGFEHVARTLSPSIRLRRPQYVSSYGKS